MDDMDGMDDMDDMDPNAGHWPILSIMSMPRKYTGSRIDLLL